MGSRPRLSADAAFAAYSNPGLAPGDYLFKNSFPPRSVVILARISHRGAGHRLGKCLSLASCSAFWGNLQGTDCAGRAWACLRSNTRDDCCRRLRGSGDGAIGFHGLTPTAKCGRRIRGLLEPPGWRPGTILFKNSFPPRSVVILARISHRGAGHRLGKCLSLASCSAFWGNLQGTDCAGRAWACLRCYRVPWAYAHG